VPRVRVVSSCTFFIRLIANERTLISRSFQLDESHERLEDFPEEDEDINSDDDTNSAPPMGKLANKAMQSRAFKMDVMNL